MKVCFWGDIGKALQGKTSGGGELQIALLARALAKAGCEVVVVDFETKEDFISNDGIKVFRIDGWNSGLPFIRNFSHRFPGLYSMLKKQNADVYYCRIRDFRHIFAYMAARKVKAKFILGIASDLDIVDFRTRWSDLALSNIRTSWGVFAGIMIEFVYPWLLRNSDFVFVQHEGQRQVLLKKGINSILFPNLIDVESIPSSPLKDRKNFVFVGWLDKRKGADDLLRIVSQASSHPFDIIGPPRDKTGRLCFEKMKSLNNVSLSGKLSHSQTLRHISDSKALVSTSPMEGFPNIFIEAWACGIPVISLYFDPGDIIKTRELGMVADGDITTMLKEIDKVVSDDGFAFRAKNYVNEYHSLNDARIHQISMLFNQLVKKSDIQSGKKAGN